MMKKITACFLVMAIAVGCSQAPVEPEKPVDPPVVEQPQKPVEQEKPKEETKVKKMDESKDWVYYVDDFESNHISVLELFNGYNDFEKFEYGNIVINVDSEDADEINNPINENSPDDSEHTINQADGPYAWISNDNYLSIFNKVFQGGSGSGWYLYKLAVLDLQNGRLLNNRQILDQFNLTMDECSMIVRGKLQDMGYSSCAVESESCYLDEHILKVIGGNKSAMIDEESLLYINEENQLSVIINIKNVDGVTDNCMEIEIK